MLSYIYIIFNGKKYQQKGTLKKIPLVHHINKFHVNEAN